MYSWCSGLVLVAKVVVLCGQCILPSMHAQHLKVVLLLSTTRSQISLGPFTETASDLTNANLGNGHVISFCIKLST